MIPAPPSSTITGVGEEIQFHSELQSDLEELGRDLAKEAGLLHPPTTMEFMLTYPGYKSLMHARCPSVPNCTIAHS